MKNIIRKVSGILLAISLVISGTVLLPQKAEAVYSVPVYRLNNPISGEYLFSSDENEVYTLSSSMGWINEGVAWNSALDGIPVYRLNNPMGYHMYTSDENEIYTLTNEYGWLVDYNYAPMFYSGGYTSVYRLYHSATGRHLLTADKNEYNILSVNGWDPEGIAIMADSSPVSQNYIRGVWFSFLDWQKYLKGKGETAFRTAFEEICDKSVENKCNTLFAHVRSHNDAIYPSDIYPWSTEMLDFVPSFDPLQIMIDVAHSRGLSFHAWVNPYGYRNGVFSGDPSLATQENIVAGVREIVTRYNVDGVHFDDYFPVDDPEKHNAMVREVYQTAHAAGKLFGISPEGTIANNIRYGADIATWMSVPGYIDYIVPQIYWSDEYGVDGTTKMYSDTLEQWQELNELDVPIYVGLALYKAGVYSERDPGWTNRSDNLLSQIRIADEAGCEGYGLFRYAFLEEPVTQQELLNIRNSL